jgi:hypothetical protein
MLHTVARGNARWQGDRCARVADNELNGNVCMQQLDSHRQREGYMAWFSGLDNLSVLPHNHVGTCIVHAAHVGDKVTEPRAWLGRARLVRAIQLHEFIRCIEAG